MTRLHSDSAPAPSQEYPSVPRVRTFKNLSGDDFRHSIDQQTTSMLRALPGLELVARSVLGGPGVEQALYLENISAALLVGPEQLPTLHRLLQEACACLNMTPPALYVRQVRFPSDTGAAQMSMSRAYACMFARPWLRSTYALCCPCCSAPGSCHANKRSIRVRVLHTFSKGCVTTA